MPACSAPVTGSVPSGVPQPRRLADPDVRIVVRAGPSGVGKTKPAPPPRRPPRHPHRSRQEWTRGPQVPPRARADADGQRLTAADVDLQGGTPAPSSGHPVTVPARDRAGAAAVDGAHPVARSAATSEAPGTSASR